MLTSMRGWKQRIRNEKGAILFIIAAAMVVLLGMAGLAFDLGSLYNVKTELQNACDAAALAGAWRLNGTDSGINAAVTDALGAVNKFQFNNQPIALANSDVSFSQFRDGPYLSAPAVIAGLAAPQMRFVRAEKSTVIPLNLIRMIPGIASTQTVDAFAVAGQSPPLNTVCDGLVPLAIVPQGPGGTLAQYTPGTFQSFSFASDLGTVGGAGSPDFLIIDFIDRGPDPLLDTNTRGCMALNSPFSLQPVTDPNVISSRLNDRFNQDGNTTPYPVGAGPNQYEQYIAGGGTGQRRLVVPFVSATPGAWAPFSIGSVAPVYVLNYGCFFLREMSVGGEIRGEFIGQCQVNGYFDPAAPIPPGLGLPNITKLVLHH